MEKKRNLWVIPTDKPSSIWINYVVKKLIYGQFTSNNTKINCQNQHIYITSDEKIISFNEINSLPLSDGKDIQTNMPNI